MEILELATRANLVLKGPSRTTQCRHGDTASAGQGSDSEAPFANFRIERTLASYIDRVWLWLRSLHNEPRRK